MTFSSTFKRIIQSPACFGPSPTLDDPMPSSTRRRAPAAPPELQSRGPQPGSPAPRGKRHWYSLKRSSPPGPQPTHQPPTHPAPARPEPRLSTREALDRLAQPHAGPPRREPTRPTLADLLAARETPSPAAGHSPSSLTQAQPLPTGTGRLDAQESFGSSSSGDPLERRHHGPVIPRLWRNLTLQPWASPPPTEAVPPVALPDVPPQRTRRPSWAKLNFLHRRSRPAEAVQGSGPHRAETPPRTPPLTPPVTPPPPQDPPAPDSPVALQPPVGPVFDESRPSSQRIDPGPTLIDPPLIDPPRIDPLQRHIHPPQMEPPSTPTGLGTRLPSWRLPPHQDSVAALDSFDRRTSDWQDPTQHGPVNRRFWNSLALQQPWASPQRIEADPPPPDTPAAAPETRRSLGAEVLRLGGVLASHTARQVVATGTSTLVREGINIGIAMGLRRQPGLAAGLTLSMTLLNLLAHLNRERRVLRAPDEAARGFHSLSQAQWQAASPAQQATLRQEQQASSRRVTRLHLASNLITTSIAMVGAARPGGRIGAMAAPVPSALLGQMARQWAYVGLRDGLQATFTTVQPSRPSPLPNTEQRRMRTAAATYGGAQALLGYAYEALTPRVLGALSQGSNTIRASGGLLSSVGSGLGQWARTIAAVAGVRAGFNVVGETIDDVQLTHHDAAEAGGEQVPSLDVRALDPARRDYGRLLDHAMVRVFANDVVGGVMNAVGLATGQLPARFADVASFVGNFGVGYLIHLTYPLVGNNFAAAGLAREAMRPQPLVDPEAGPAPLQHPPGSSTHGSQVSRASSYYRPEA